jgi:hypothetical protein
MSRAGTAFGLGLQVLLLVCAGCATDEDARAAISVRQALSSSEWLVAFRTNDGLHYLTAELDGGSTVSADRTKVDIWERWIITDLDGGELLSGDLVNIRYVSSTGSSWWASADNGGGGPGCVLEANRTQPGSWETFRIRSADDVIHSGSNVTLRATTHPFYVSVQFGGGGQGEGSVTVDRTDATSWEILTVLAIEPASLCPDSDMLCLFEGPSFVGERIELAAVGGDDGTCLDLEAQGWGGRAHSAVNTRSGSVTLMTSVDCSGERVEIAAGAMEPTLPFSPAAALVF